MINSITIRVRRDSAGQLVGVDSSDVWNLETLAMGGFAETRGNTDLARATTAASLANYRRALAKLGFVLAVETVKPTVKLSRPRASKPSARISRTA